MLAIGSPFGLDSTVTAGIVSAKQRETGSDIALLQTDVAVNPGNSGGPLVDTRREVVGVNSQILSPVGSYIGISFAIPIDEAMRIADQLRASGRWSRLPRRPAHRRARELAEGTVSRSARAARVAHSCASRPTRRALRQACSPATSC